MTAVTSAPTTVVFGIPVFVSRYVQPGTALVVGNELHVSEEPCPVCTQWGGACRTRRGHRRHDHRARNRHGLVDGFVRQLKFGEGQVGV